MLIMSKSKLSGKPHIDSGSYTHFARHIYIYINKTETFRAEEPQYLRIFRNSCVKMTDRLAQIRCGTAATLKRRYDQYY